MVNSRRATDHLCTFIKYQMDIRSQERIFFELHTNNITDNNYSGSKPPFRLCIPCPSPSPLAPPPCQSSSVSPAPSPSPPEMAPPSMLTKSGPPPHQTDVSRPPSSVWRRPRPALRPPPPFFTRSVWWRQAEGRDRGKEETQKKERERKKEEGAPLISTLREIITDGGDSSDVCFGSAWTIAETAAADSYLRVSLRRHTWARGGGRGGEGKQLPRASKKSAYPCYCFSSATCPLPRTKFSLCGKI